VYIAFHFFVNFRQFLAPYNAWNYVVSYFFDDRDILLFNFRHYSPCKTNSTITRHGL